MPALYHKIGALQREDKIVFIEVIDNLIEVNSIKVIRFDFQATEHFNSRDYQPNARITSSLERLKETAKEYGILTVSILLKDNTQIVEVRKFVRRDEMEKLKQEILNELNINSANDNKMKIENKIENNDTKKYQVTRKIKSLNN